MLARTHAFTIDGLQARHVCVEVDVRSGLPSFAIVGLADVAVREARERIQAAIRNAGYEFPARRITANLAPGDLPKAGPGLDLALACAVLAASGQLSRTLLERVALFGELALDGAVRASHGTLAVAEAAHRAGLSMLALAAPRAAEARLIDGLEVAVVGHLRSAVRLLEGGAASPPPRRRSRASPPRGAAVTEPDLAEVQGQRHAVRALVIAAAGGHHCLLSGPPGSGKTMLAHRLAGILPPLSAAEAIEVTRIHSLAGASPEGLVRRRPFRAPHHSATTAGLIGGARRGCVGEIVLAHNGVLFLDELSEFARATLEALRQPLEEGRVAIARARRSAVYPARFMLLAATNPCACGYAGEGERCACSEAELARHRRRLSGPLVDRMDLVVHLQRSGDAERGAAGTMSSAEARERVLLARERQLRRLAGEGLAVNAQMDARLLREHTALDADAEELMRRVRERAMLSMRGEHRVLRVARTIADLNSHARVGAHELGSALALRAEVGPASSRAA
jgi:magnesium chelatase family protein